MKILLKGVTSNLRQILREPTVPFPAYQLIDCVLERLNGGFAVNFNQGDRDRLCDLEARKRHSDRLVC